MVRTVCLVIALTLLAGPGAAVAFGESVSGLRAKLEKAVGSKSRGDVREIAAQLVELDTAEAMDVLIEKGLLCDDSRIEEIIREALYRVKKDGAAVARLCEQCKDHEAVAVRDQLTQVLAFIKSVEAYRAVLQNLYDREDSVVLAACEALSYKNNLGSVSHLIRALEYQEQQSRQNSVVAQDIRRALTSLTTYEFDASKEWRAFWNKNQVGFKRPTKAEVKARKEGSTRQRGTAVVKRERKVPKFFGMEIPAQRIVFILDVSISMNIVDPMPEDGTKVVGSRMRIRRVQEELSRMLSNMPSDTRFTVICFSDKVRILSQSLMPATMANKNAARQFAAKFDPGGQTHTDEALKAAFKIKGARHFILLSDGAPVRATKVIDVNQVLFWVDQTNRFRRVKISTIGFKQARESIGDFLPELAHRNGGTFVELP